MSVLVKTWDGVTLHCTQTGPQSAPNLLLIPGWSQTAAQWRKQVEFFSKTNRVTTYDHRGHGESEKPQGGYRVSRLASDLNDLIIQLDLKDVTIVGHSMGCCVTWSYWELFADSRKRISKLVFVDEPATLVANPDWTDAQKEAISAVFTPQSLYETANGIQLSSDVRVGLLKGMCTSSMSQEDFDWILEQNCKMTAKDAATLLLDHAWKDWSDVLPTIINVPTLVIGAKGSIVTNQGIENIANLIKGSSIEIFERDQGGSHFMFWENPEKFNSVIYKFLEK
jgi:pimeloyl-ACP methyl ester carboxylesterase